MLKSFLCRQEQNLFEKTEEAHAFTATKIWKTAAIDFKLMVSYSHFRKQLKIKQMELSFYVLSECTRNVCVHTIAMFT